MAGKAELMKLPADERVVRATIEQIKKDFASYLPELVFSGSQTDLYEELKCQIAFAINNLSKENPIALNAIFYKVDLAQRMVKAPHDSDFLAEQVIQRELKKVLAREFFR